MFRLFILLAIGSLLVSAQQIDKLKVGVIMPLTGALAPYGKDAVAGIQMASRQPASLEVELLIRDNQSSTRLAGQLASELIDKHRVQGIIGAISSSATQAIARIAQQQQRLHIVPVSSAETITKMGSHIFRSCVSDSYRGAVLAKFSIDTLQKKRAAILIEENSIRTIEPIVASFRRYLQNHGGMVVEQLTFNRKTRNSVLRRLARQSPGVILLPSSYRLASTVIAQARRFGITANFLSAIPWTTAPQRGRQKTMHYYLSHFSADDSYAAVTRFATQFKLQHQRVPSEFAALSYDALGLLVDAAQRAKSTRIFPLLANLSRTKNFLGISGELAINRQRTAIKATYVVGLDRSVHKISPLAVY